MNASAHAKRQEGAVLIVTLLMIVVITMLAVASVTNSNIDLRIIDNIRSVQEQERAVMEGMEVMISNSQHFTDPNSMQETIHGHEVWLEAPECVHARPSTGSSAHLEGTQDVEPREQTTWKNRACATDATDCNDAPSTLNQGVTIRLAAGYCN